MRIIDLATGTATSADNIAIDSSSGGTRKVPLLSTVNALITAGISALSSAVSALSTRVGSVETAVGQRLLVTGPNVPVNVECAANAVTVVLNYANMSEYLPSGATLQGAVFGWTNGSILYPVNCQVQNGTLFLALYNPSVARTITAVALQLFYTV